MDVRRHVQIAAADCTNESRIAVGEFLGLTLFNRKRPNSAGTMIKITRANVIATGP